MSQRRKIILYASALSILLAFPAGRRAGDASAKQQQPPKQKGDRHQPLKSRPRAAQRIHAGAWGGEHISLQVSERGATVEFDCAHATITQRIVLDRRGRFSVAGNYFEEHGGPVRAGDESDGDAANFNGRVEGKTLKLNVTRAATGELIGNFTLTHLQEPALVKCR
jgi:hypothetical protein